MRIDTLLVWATVGAIIILLVAWPSSASRATSLPAFQAGERAALEQADYRRCWRKNGQRHCRWVEGKRPRVYGYNPRPENNLLPPNLGLGL